jgi:hypothetical protein
VLAAFGQIREEKQQRWLSSSHGAEKICPCRPHPCLSPSRSCLAISKSSWHVLLRADVLHELQHYRTYDNPSKGQKKTNQIRSNPSCLPQLTTASIITCRNFFLLPVFLILFLCLLCLISFCLQIKAFHVYFSELLVPRTLSNARNGVKVDG